jgi:hypothetical protein
MVTMERQRQTTLAGALQRGVAEMKMDAALADLLLASDEPEFDDDAEGVLRAWVRETRGAGARAPELADVLYDVAQRGDLATAEEYGAALNAFRVVRAAMKPDRSYYLYIRLGR